MSGSAGGPYTITFGGAQAGINVSTLTWRPADTDPLANSDFLGSLIYEYDAAGQMTDAFYQDGSLANIAGNFFAYDGLGRVTQETMTFGGYSDTITLGQQFDASGNRTGTTWNFGTTEELTGTFTYDGLGRLTQQTHASDEQADYWHRATFSYNKLGQFEGISRFVGTSGTPIGVADSDFTYDDLNRLTSIEHYTGGTTWAGYDYTYDDASRITSINSFLDGLSEYTHDNTNQLTGADHTGATDETYTYDANGNRTMSGYTTGDNNQLLSDGVHDYTYDAEGNRATRTVIATGYVTEYAWDHRNRLVKVTEKDDLDNVLSTVDHWYDAFNRWIRRSADADGMGGSNLVETIFAHDGFQVAKEFTDNDGVDLDGENLAHAYTWGPVVDQLIVDFTDGDVPQWALTDHLGSVRDFVEYDAGMTDTVDNGHRIFDSFGKITSQMGLSSLIGFTGRLFDESTGLQNNLNRWYDPAVGRWVSEDPIGFLGHDTNIARYSWNQSIRFTDPSGLTPPTFGFTLNDGQQQGFISRPSLGGLMGWDINSTAGPAGSEQGTLYDYDGIENIDTKITVSKGVFNVSLVNGRMTAKFTPNDPRITNVRYIQVLRLQGNHDDSNKMTSVGYDYVLDRYNNDRGGQSKWGLVLSGTKYETTAGWRVDIDYNDNFRPETANPFYGGKTNLPPKNITDGPRNLIGVPYTLQDFIVGAFCVKQNGSMEPLGFFRWGLLHHDTRTWYGYGRYALYQRIDYDGIENAPPEFSGALNHFNQTNNQLR